MAHDYMTYDRVAGDIVAGRWGVCPLGGEGGVSVRVGAVSVRLGAVSG